MAYDELGPAEIDRLADYIGGALDGTGKAEVARLIAEDQRWRETYELLAPSMAAVGAELRVMGSAAEPMPHDLAVRLDEALAAEPERRLSLVPGSSDGVKIRPRRRLRWAVPVAAAAGVLAFAGFGIDYLTDRSATDNGTTAGSSAEQAAPMVGSDSAGTGSAVRDAVILETGTNYTAASLRGAPFAAMTNGREGASAPTQEANQRAGKIGAGVLGRLRASDALQACIDAITLPHATGPIAVETVDFARYDSRPALVVRFIAGSATWAYAVGPDCGTPERGTDLRNRVQVR